MARKTVNFTKGGVAKLPEDKSVLYRVQTESGRTNYAGVAKRGRVQARIAEHLFGGRAYVPGVRVQIEQMNSIEQARATEGRIIARSKPKYNELRK